MRLPSNIQTSVHTTLTKPHKSLPSINLLPNGKPSPTANSFSSMAAPTLEANTTHITTTYTHLISILQNSRVHRSLRIGKLAHAFILRSGFEPNLFISNNLLSIYWSCGSFLHALRLFNRMLQRDAVSWNTMISGWFVSRQFRDGYYFFREMIRVGTRPTQSSFASVIVASAEMGGFKYLQQVHCFSLKSGFSSDCCVGNALLKGYANFKKVEDLWKLSEEMCGLDEISFEILLRGYSQHGMFDNALILFKYSCLIGINLSPFAVSSLISLCTSLCFIDHGIQIHGYAIKLGLDTDVSVVNSLITMYSRSYSLEDARHLFDWFGSQKTEIVTWNSLIGGFAYNGEGDAALALVQRLLSSGIGMNEMTFLSFLSCCAVVSVLKNAKKAHGMILKLRECFDQRTDNIILTMYCRSKSLEDAVVVFEAMEVRDIVSFNLMMGLYRNCGSYEESIKLFYQARLKGIGVDEAMLSGVIRSCSKLGFLELGQQIHGCVIRTGFEKDSHLKNSLLELYSQVGRIDDMERIFFEDCNEPNLFSWNTMLIGYAQYGLFDKSIGIWKEMEKMGVELNEFSYSALLNTCGGANKLLIGEQIHACVRKKGLVFDTALMNSLLTMYSNCGMMEKALSVFEETSSPDSISWNAMVSGYSQVGFAEESVKFYKLMSKTGVETNHMTFASICMCCTMLSEVKLGSQCHAQVIRRAFELDLPVSNSLITMYAKCGEIHHSSKIFQNMVYKDLITWNSMISALAHHGLGKEAINVFEKMKYFGVKPNNVTFIGILSACSRAGLVSEACYQFNSMHEDHGIAPSEEHYACLVDILCRAGKLAEAKDLIEGMPFDPCSLVWRTLLSACRVNGEMKLGEVAAKRIMELEPQDSASYVLLSDLYASVGNRENKAEVRRIMEDRGVKKEVGYSWIFSV